MAIMNVLLKNKKALPAINRQGFWGYMEYEFSALLLIMVTCHYQFD